MKLLREKKRNQKRKKERKMKGPVAVTGAAGYIGSWLVMRLLEKGYIVRATVRDPSNIFIYVFFF